MADAVCASVNVAPDLVKPDPIQPVQSNFKYPTADIHQTVVCGVTPAPNINIQSLKPTNLIGQTPLGGPTNVHFVGNNSAALKSYPLRQAAGKNDLRFNTGQSSSLPDVVMSGRMRPDEICRNPMLQNPGCFSPPSSLPKYPVRVNFQMNAMASGSPVQRCTIVRPPMARVGQNVMRNPQMHYEQPLGNDSKNSAIRFTQTNPGCGVQRANFIRSGIMPTSRSIVGTSPVRSRSPVAARQPVPPNGRSVRLEFRRVVRVSSQDRRQSLLTPESTMFYNQFVSFMRSRDDDGKSAAGEKNTQSFCDAFAKFIHTIDRLPSATRNSDASDNSLIRPPHGAPTNMLRPANSRVLTSPMRNGNRAALVSFRLPKKMEFLPPRPAIVSPVRVEGGSKCVVIPSQPINSRTTGPQSMVRFSNKSPQNFTVRANFKQALPALSSGIRQNLPANRFVLNSKTQPNRIEKVTCSSQPSKISMQVMKVATPVKNNCSTLQKTSASVALLNDDSRRSPVSLRTLPARSSAMASAKNIVLKAQRPEYSGVQIERSSNLTRQMPKKKKVPTATLR